MERRFSFYNASDPRRYGTDSHGKYEVLLDKLIEEHLARNKQDMIIEIGCGKGAFRGHYPNYIGCDISLYALKSYFNNIT